MAKSSDIAKEYCIGCGLCKSVKNVEMAKDSLGFLKINKTISQEEDAFISSVCPVIGSNFADSGNSIWGDNLGIFQGFSSDVNVRRKASSGGVITSISLFLLETGKIDGVIAIKASADNPVETECVVCTTRSELLSCCGSRYCISSPWVNLSDIADSNKRYMAVGKPCDISSLRKAQEKEGLFLNIEYLISFFCAGMPSDRANEQLLKALNCSNANCSFLNYRGNGWPGYTTAKDISGNEYRMEYSQSWGGILGRDVNKYCRICIDGIGISADFACGDGWLVKNGKPDFSEHEGRNVIIARTTKGVDLLNEAQNAGYINLDIWDDVESLKIIQNYQYLRRATMKEKITALKIFGRKVPCYPKDVMDGYSQVSSLQEKRQIFWGTIKRIIKGKM